MEAIRVEGLTKLYGQFEALRGITFAVDEGEVLCLLGPNGAGKTTTVEILEGYRVPTSGSVSVLGHDPAAAERSLFERVGIVLQSCGVQSQLSVAELLSMYGSYYPHPRAVPEVLELVELREKAGSFAKALSGGQRRRLDLALALIGDPDLIFLDEPTTGFDPSARRQAWSTIRSLCDLGKTVLLTTHYMDEAQTLADRVVVIAAGRVVAEGTPDDIGGRDRAPTRISFALPEGVEVTDLPAMAGATVYLEHGGVMIETQDGLRVANVITGWALEHGHLLGGFAVAQPSLEDVYLELTGDARLVSSGETEVAQ
jgi:ABC-2 type transport system ATP-binding protein